MGLPPIDLIDRAHPIQVLPAGHAKWKQPGFHNLPYFDSTGEIRARTSHVVSGRWHVLEMQRRPLKLGVRAMRGWVWPIA